MTKDQFNQKADTFSAFVSGCIWTMVIVMAVEVILES